MKRGFLLVVALCAMVPAGLLSQDADADRAPSLLRQGDSLMKEKKPEQAEPIFRKATTLAPKNALAFYYLGVSEMSLSKDLAATEAMETALKLDAASPGLLRRQRRECIDILGLAYANMKQYDKAMAVYADAVAKDPEYANFPYNQACICSQAGDRKTALAALWKALTLDAQSDLGRTLPDPGADQDLKGLWGDPVFHAILIASQNPQPNDGPGMSLGREGARRLATGDAAGAVEAITAALQAEPTMVKGWFLLAGAQEALGKPSEAAAAYRKALELNVAPRAVLNKPMIRRAEESSAKEYRANNKYNEAILALRAADAADPYSASLFYQIALTYAAAGDMGETQAALKQAYSLRGQMAPSEPPLPDPSKDPGFSRWADDKAWREFLASLGP
jgi:tetratricopeptide (TPR) repeat protein